MGFFSTKFEFMTTTFWPLGGAKVWKSWIGFSSFWVQKILKFQFHMKWKVHSSFYRSFCIGVDPVLVWFKKRFSCVSMHYINTAAKCLLLLPISYFQIRHFARSKSEKRALKMDCHYLFSHYYFTTSSQCSFQFCIAKFEKHVFRR